MTARRATDEGGYVYGQMRRAKPPLTTSSWRSANRAPTPRRAIWYLDIMENQFSFRVDRNAET